VPVGRGKGKGNRGAGGRNTEVNRLIGGYIRINRLKGV
jgi:hypothetical protein